MNFSDIKYEITETIPTVNLANIVEIKPPYVHFKRKANEYILYYILSGEMYIKQDDHEYVLKEHEYIILDPEYTHVGYKSSVARFLYIHFNGGVRRADDLTAEESSGHIIIPGYCKINSRENHVSLLGAAEETIRSMRRDSILSKRLASNSLENVLLTIASDYMLGAKLKTIDVHGKIRDVIPKIVTYLDTEFAEEITGTTLEDKFNFHFDYMNRQFSKWTGCTIFTYLTRVRIDQARQLLSTGYYSTKEVAAMTGFKDVSYFSKVFKKETGTTPGKWS